MIYTDKYMKDMLSVIPNVIGFEKLRNSKILITGSNGLICSGIIDFLMLVNQNYDFNIDVYAAGRSREKNEKRFSQWNNDNRFFFVEYDATKVFNSSVEFDYIIHGAGNASPSLYLKEPVETMLSNILGLKTLLDYSINHKTKKILYISSSEVYGRKENKSSFVENDYGFMDILDVRSCYPSAKRAAETLCSSYKSEYGLDFVIARPGHVYGPTMTETDGRVSSVFPRNVLNGEDIVMKSKGEQLRSYCYVVDCVSAILTILLVGESGEAYNISNSESIVSIKEMAECFASEGNCKLLFDIPTITEKKAFNKMDNSSLDSAKLEKLGWTAKFNLKNGVKGTLDAGKCKN